MLTHLITRLNLPLTLCLSNFIFSLFFGISVLYFVVIPIIRNVAEWTPSAGEVPEEKGGKGSVSYFASLASPSA